MEFLFPNISVLRTPKEKECIQAVPYASIVGNLMYVVLYTRLDIYFVVGMVSRYQSKIGLEHWAIVKHILKCLRRMIDYMLVF